MDMNELKNKQSEDNTGAFKKMSVLVESRNN